MWCIRPWDAPLYVTVLPWAQAAKDQVAVYVVTCALFAAVKQRDGWHNTIIEKPSGPSAINVDKDQLLVLSATWQNIKQLKSLRFVDLYTWTWVIDEYSPILSKGPMLDGNRMLFAILYVWRNCRSWQWYRPSVWN